MGSLLTKIFGPKCSMCQTRRTRQQLQGQPVCQRCQTELQAEAEEKTICPNCAASIIKQIEQTVVYDKCPACGGVWLDKSELETLTKLASATGQASGQATGAVMGMMMAPSHHHR
jgi:hypothetical protein